MRRQYLDFLLSTRQRGDLVFQAQDRIESMQTCRRYRNIHKLANRDAPEITAGIQRLSAEHSGQNEIDIRRQSGTNRPGRSAFLRHEAAHR